MHDAFIVFVTTTILMAGFYFSDNILDFNSSSSMNDCFRNFDKNNKNYLDNADFHLLVESVITGKTKPTAEESNTFFSTFDRNGDGRIDLREFRNVWNHWIKKLLKPVTALLVIDVQNDFVSGSLALINCPAKQEGRDVIPVINNLLENLKTDAVVYSLDYHPENHISFFGNQKLYPLRENRSDIKMFDTVSFSGPPEMEQKLWPKHCIQGTWGAELHPDLKVVQDALMIHKGTRSELDSYSVFWDNMKLNFTKLDEELQKRQVTHVFVAGLAYDYCVGFSALDALELGYATVVVEDASRGTDLNTIESMAKNICNNHGVLSNSNELHGFATGKDVRLEFAKVFEKQVQKRLHNNQFNNHN